MANGWFFTDALVIYMLCDSVGRGTSNSKCLTFLFFSNYTIRINISKTSHTTFHKSK